MEIIVTIDLDGNPQISVVNGDGKTCLAQTQELEVALGEVVERSFKPEYRQTAKVQNRLRQRQ